MKDINNSGMYSLSSENPLTRAMNGVYLNHKIFLSKKIIFLIIKTEKKNKIYNIERRFMNSICIPQKKTFCFVLIFRLTR